MLLSCTGAYALDPNRSITQYKHTLWTIDDGAPPDIRALAQTRDGYLWIGAATGLFRFDGVVFEAMPDLGSATEGHSVTALFKSRSGELWIGYDSGCIAVMRGGRQVDVTPPFGIRSVKKFAQDRDGAIWVESRGFRAPIIKYGPNGWSKIDDRSGYVSSAAGDILTSGDGYVWINSKDGLYFLPPGQEKFILTSVRLDIDVSLVEGRAGQIWWVGGAGGAGRLYHDDKTETARIGQTEYPAVTKSDQRSSLFDNADSLWTASNSAGLFRLPTARLRPGVDDRAQPNAVENYGAKDGLSSDTARVVTQDREGDIWVGTSVGLDRFRPADVVMEPRIPAHSRWGYVLMSDSRGVIYVVDSDHAYRIRPGAAPEQFPQTFDNPEALCEGPDGAIWLATHGGLFRLQGDRFEAFAGPSGVHSYLDCAADRRGALWFAASRSRFFRLQGQRWDEFEFPGIEGDQVVSAMVPDPNGGLLASLLTKGVVRIDPPRFDLLWPYHRMPGGNANVLYAGGRGILVAAAAGLARIQGGHVDVLPRQYPWLEGVVGLVQTARGETWMLSRAGIVRLSTQSVDSSFTNLKASLAPQILDHRDGLYGPPTTAFVKNSAAVGGDGRVWFVTADGIVKVDPSHLVHNAIAPNVVISALIVDGLRHRDPTTLRLPKGVSQIEIDYSALCLTAPERVRFFYRLEGVDKDWIDPGARRQAFYSRLPPGHYRFKVIASNNDGVWNRTGASITFDLPPTFLQSNLFHALCLIAGALVLWCLYSLRLSQMGARMRLRMQERIAERERIARELHDTILQSTQGLVLRFQAVADRIPADEPARQMMEQALDRADVVLAEGRDRVVSLRSTDSEDTLPKVLEDAARRVLSLTEIEVRVVVEGSPRPTQSLVGEELARLAEEFMLNTVQHARARHVDIEIRFGRTQLALRLVDDGVGIDPDILRRGRREGHFGLLGMRERSQKIGGAFTIASRAGAGTEIVVTIPARAAYRDYRPYRRNILSARGVAE